MLFPHTGDWRTAGVHQAALNLNMPLRIRQGVAHNPRKLVHYDALNITPKAVKRAEDGKHLIVRLVERHNTRSHVTLAFDRDITAAWTCDLMERAETALQPDGSRVEVTFKPYEIVTLRLAFK